MRPLPWGFKLHHNILLFLVIIILFSTVSLIAANSVFIFSHEIYRGVTIADIPVGDLSAAKADEKIAQILQERIKQPVITIRYGDQTWKIMAEEIDFTVDTQALAMNAYQVGRRGNVLQKLQERYTAIYNSYHLPLTSHYDSNKLYTILANIAQTIDLQPQNATIQVSGAGITINREVPGQKVDLAKAMADTASQLAVNINITVPLLVAEISPSIVASDLEDIDGIIASYTTQFNDSDRNRTQNIRLAAKSINEILIRANSTFSFNQQVGLRLAEYGYKEAPVFIDGKLVPDWGGGVCQVSSTLYNAVLLADLDIEERNSHYSPPGYVPLGQDATVADNLLDFKFKNTLDTNIYITSEVSGNQLIVNIIGKRSNVPEIRIIAEQKALEPNHIVKLDSKLEFGREIVESSGQRGFIVTTYRVKYVNGSEVNREWLATDEFKPTDRVVIVGTKVPATQPTK